MIEIFKFQANLSPFRLSSAIVSAALVRSPSLAPGQALKQPLEMD